MKRQPFKPHSARRHWQGNHMYCSAATRILSSPYYSLQQDGFQARHKRIWQDTLHFISLEQKAYDEHAVYRREFHAQCHLCNYRFFNNRILDKTYFKPDIFQNDICSTTLTCLTNLNLCVIFNYINFFNIYKSKQLVEFFFNITI